MSKNNTKNLEKTVKIHDFYTPFFDGLSEKFPGKHPPKHPPKNNVFGRVFPDFSTPFLSFFGISENTPQKLGKHVPNFMFCRIFWGGSKFRENFVKIFDKNFCQNRTKFVGVGKICQNRTKFGQNLTKFEQQL